MPLKVADIEEGLLMLDERGPVWETVNRASEALRAAGIPFAVVGGLAVFSHGYRRTTDDVDLLIYTTDQARVREVLQAAGIPWSRSRREFVGARNTPIHILFADERIGSTDVHNPEPTKANVSEIGPLLVLKLARLIEIKLAVGTSVIRRSHQDLADVVELIAANKLTKTFAARLHKSVRQEFKRLVDVARSPE